MSCLGVAASLLDLLALLLGRSPSDQIEQLYDQLVQFERDVQCFGCGPILWQFQHKRMCL